MRIRTTDISPDGVRIVIDWDTFTVGSSVFIPCVNTKRAVQHVREAAKLSVEQIQYRVRVEDGKYGVRVWRCAD